MRNGVRHPDPGRDAADDVSKESVRGMDSDGPANEIYRREGFGRAVGGY